MLGPGPGYRNRLFVKKPVAGAGRGLPDIGMGLFPTAQHLMNDLLHGLGLGIQLPVQHQETQAMGPCSRLAMRRW